VPIPIRPEPGRIVWAEFLDTGGNQTYAHPAVILTGKVEIDAGGLIVVAVVSTKLHLSKAEDQIPLPWMARPGGHPVTKLNKKCAVVCNWIRPIQEKDVLGYAGVVPSRTFEAILARVSELMM
jgi:mRNA-degrading endonuclease toxin of MazEF toxin-antitoxin module